MSNRFFKLFFSLHGRIGRKTFIACFAAWMAFYLLQVVWFQKTGNNLFNFFLSLVLLFINLQIIFSVYGKRLHDLGRSIRPIIALFVLLVLGWIFLMLNFGGLEYFDTVYQNPDIVENEAAMREITETYQQAIRDKVPQTQMILGVLPVLFTLWLAVQPGNAGENAYGKPYGKPYGKRYGQSINS